MRAIKAHGRLLVSVVSLAVAFVLSVQFSDRGVQFDLKNTSVSASEATGVDYDLASLKILNRVLLQIKDNYVEPDRVAPNKMLVSALNEIQNAIAEVVVAFDTDEENPRQVTLAVNDEKKTFQIGEIESLWEMSFRLREMFRFVQEHLDSAEVEYRDVEYAAINGMLSTLDPHSTLLPPRSYEEMQTQTGGKFGGLGIVISIRDGQLTVISPIADTPAARAGVKARDHVVRIGEESTINMQLNDAVNMLRGEPGTAVDLWLKRQGWNEPRKFTVERAIIKIDSVDSEPLQNKIGYVRIKNFQANTFTDLKTHLGTLKEKMGGMQGLVLDLRDNPGGLLDQAIKVSDLFLNDGTIVSTVGIGNRLREKREARANGTEPDYPIIVLVNAGSASASEIVSGALQNHNRAVVLGDRTFGKGSVQVVYEFPDNSALKLTIAQYLTPGGISIQSKGISPDLFVLPVAIERNNVDLFLSTKTTREQDLDAHLTSSAVRQDGEPMEFLRYLHKNDNEDDEFRDPDAFFEDFEIRLAQQLLATAPKATQRAEMLAAYQDTLQQVEAREFTQIKNELRKLGVDWSQAPEGVNTTASNPQLDVRVATDPPTGQLNAGDELSVTVTVTNTSDAPIYQLKALSASAYSVYDDHEFVFGKLDPNQTKKWTVHMTVPKDAPSRHDIVDLTFSDAHAEIAKDQQLAVNVVGKDRPQFGFSYEIADTSGDGVLSVGEAVTLRVFIQNFGAADSAETLVFLKNLAHEALYLKTGRGRIDSIAAGGTQMLEFEFDVKAAPKEGDMVELEVDIYDSTHREYTEKKFAIPFATSEKDRPAVQDAVGAVSTSMPLQVHVAADVRSDIAAVTHGNVTLPVTGELDGWLRVGLNGRAGWVPASAVRRVPNAHSLDPFSRDVMFQPPSVQLATDTLITSEARVALRGTATDDSAVKDYYVFVYNRDNTKLNSRKLKYVRATGAEVDITLDVPLYKGMNRIAVIARDDDGMSTTQSTFVYRR